MGMRLVKLLAVGAALLTLAVGLLACGGGDDSEISDRLSRIEVATAAPAATTAPSAPEAGQDGAMGRAGPTGAPGAGGFLSNSSESAALLPAPTAAPRRAAMATAAPPPTPASPASKVQASMAAQQRIIVHTGNMLLVVGDVAGSVDSVIALASELGGWVVSSDRSSRHSGSVSIRVPAQRLAEVMDRLEDMAIDAKSRNLSSQDVTDEFVDTQSRLTSLRETERVLLDLVARADNVEHALRVHQEISQIQLQIEQMQGRINFLQQTAAYSLLIVRLELSTNKMPVNVGPDSAYRVGQGIRFSATFQPPEGVEHFTFRWDFGDGNQASGTGSAPKADDPSTRVTSSVHHTYHEEGDYIAEITISGAGETGLVEGSDAAILSVTHVPNIEVFAGDNRVVDEGDDVEYRGSFTRPEGLWDFEYRWDFGDGTPTVVSAPDEGVTRASALHSYADHRPHAYEATLSVSAMSDAGRVTNTATFFVQVNESVGFLVGGWDAAGTGKTAVRALSALARFLLTAIIWIGVFSPVWLIVVGLIIWNSRRARDRNDDEGNSPRRGFRLPGWRPSRSGEEALNQDSDD